MAYNTHIFRESSFNFQQWQNSTNCFECATTPSQQYTLLCRYRWDSVNDELKLCREGINRADATLFIVLITIAVQLLLICTLVMCICAIKKKLKRYQPTIPNDQGTKLLKEIKNNNSII